MTAWVIRQEREGEPKDAFQIEEIEVPEPGAFEVIVRVMAAGVNFNNVWAALGKPVSVFRYHPEDGPPHRRLRRLRRDLEGRRGRHAVEGRRRGRDPLQPGLLRGRRGARPRPARGPSQKIWGYETSWGSFAQFTKVQAQQLVPKPQNLTWEEAASYGLTYFTAYRMLIDQVELQAGHKVLIWGAAGGLGVFATQLCKLTGADCGGRRVLRREGRARQAARRQGLHQPQRVRGHDAQGRRVPRGGEGALRPVSRAFAKRVKEILGDAPDIVFEHVGQATFPTSVFVVKPFGKVVICGATSGYNLDFDVRYLWMRQKQIIGSHFANAWEATKANELIAQSKIRPVLWRVMPFEGVAEAHQLMRENKHLGKIAILVGAESEGQGKTAEGPGRDPRRGRELRWRHSVSPRAQRAGPGAR